MSDAMPAEWVADGSNEQVADHIAAFVRSHPRAVIALPGGATPRAILHDLAARPIDWSGVTVMLTDERIVPPGHPASNQSMLEDILGMSGAQFRLLEHGAIVPELALVWLGMGTDGHIASLFPQMDAEELPGPRVIRTVPDPLPREAPFPRLSLNLEALASADEVILVVRGEEKRAVLEAALHGAPELPVAQLAAKVPIRIYWSAQ
jgi:6-phosphogluconolactonase